MGFEIQFRLDFAVYKTKTTSYKTTQFIIYICEHILLVITKIKSFKMQCLRNNIKYFSKYIVPYA